jgi:hypothetical protein
MLINEQVVPDGCSEHTPCTQPLSYTQERYWLLSLYEPENPAYHCFKAFHLKGN